MTDNVQFQRNAKSTPPDNTQVATDDVGGAHYQRLKLDVGGDGVSVPVANASGYVPVIANGSLIDTDNTSTANLSSGAVFTGAWTDTLEYSAIIVACAPDVASATDGLDVQWSADGVNVHDHDYFTIGAGKSKTYNFQPAWQYYRVVYTNGATGQSSFVLQSQIKKTPIRGSTHRVGDSISAEDDAELMKTVLTGLSPAGDFKNVLVTNAGNQKISIEEFETGVSSDGRLLTVAKPFYLDVAEGNVTGHSIMNKFGQNDALGTGAYEDVWDGGGTYVYPATALITHIYSSTSGDTQQIEVQGLSSSGALTIQTETLTGTVVAPLTTPLWRVFRLKNVGTTDNAGTIHASDSGKVVNYAQIGIGNNQTLMALYTIPLGKTGYMVSSQASLAGLQSAYYVGLKRHMRPFGGVFQLKGTNGISTTASSFVSAEAILPSKIPALTDIKISAISSKAAGIVNSRFSILLIDD